jgi:hypothetical protein
MGEAILLIVSVVVIAGFSTIYSSSVSSIGDALRAQARELKERVETRLVVAAVHYDAAAGELLIYVKNVGRRGLGGGELSAVSVYLYSRGFFEHYVYGDGPGSWSYEIVADSHSNDVLDWSDTILITARPRAGLGGGTYVARLVTPWGGSIEAVFSVAG